MKRLSEGIVGNIGKRSLGKLQRKEDIIDDELSFDELKKYIFKIYDMPYIKDSYESIKIPLREKNNKLYVLEIRSSIAYIDNIQSVYNIYSKTEFNQVKKDLINKNFELNDIGYFGDLSIYNYLQTPFTNKEIINIIDIVISNIEQCLTIKKKIF